MDYPAPAIRLALLVILAACGSRSGLKVPELEGSHRLSDAGTSDTSDAEPMPDDGGVPVDADSARQPRALISLGRDANCATYGDGADQQLYCWGNNSRGQSGVGHQRQTWTPVPVVGLPPIRSLAAARYVVCAVDVEGQLWCWGELIGASFPTPSLVPARVPTPGPVSAVDAGVLRTCILLEEGGVRCFGVRADEGCSVEPAPEFEPGWVDPGFADDVVEIAVSVNNVCARHEDGTVSCAGCNAAASPLGPDPERYFSTPRQVPELNDVISLRMVAATRWALLASGDVMGWGANLTGALGLSERETHSIPVPVPGAEDVVEVAPGSPNSCVLFRDGSVACVGDSDERFGTESCIWDRQLSAPVLREVLPPGSAIAIVSANEDNRCVRRPDGSVYCWGCNARGNVGDGTNEVRRLPVPTLPPL